MGENFYGGALSERIKDEFAYTPGRGADSSHSDCYKPSASALRIDAWTKSRRYPELGLRTCVGKECELRKILRMIPEELIA